MSEQGPVSGRAAVFAGPDRPLELREFPVPAVRENELLVEVLCCTVCGSDVHTASGRRSTPLPTVLGHEVVGTVLSPGGVRDATGRELSPGDRVVWSVAASCGTCDRCHGGLPQKCRDLFKYGHEPLTDEPRSPFRGGLAEFCILKPGTAVVRVPKTLPDPMAATAGCATATAAAAVRTCGDVAGRDVLILGAGLLGLTTCAMTATLGARSICVCDPNAARRDLSLQFGATQIVATPAEAAYDCTFEMSGARTAVAAAIEAAAIGGRIVLVGSVMPTEPVPLDPEQIVRRLLSIHGVHNYVPGDLVHAVGFLAAHYADFPFSSQVGRTYALDQVNEALEAASGGASLRVAVTPNSPGADR